MNGRNLLVKLVERLRNEPGSKDLLDALDECDRRFDIRKLAKIITDINGRYPAVAEEIPAAAAFVAYAHGRGEGEV